MSTSGPVQQRPLHERLYLRCRECTKWARVMDLIDQKKGCLTPHCVRAEPGHNYTTQHPTFITDYGAVTALVLYHEKRLPQEPADSEHHFPEWAYILPLWRLAGPTTNIYLRMDRFARCPGVYDNDHDVAEVVVQLTGSFIYGRPRLAPCRISIATEFNSDELQAVRYSPPAKYKANFYPPDPLIELERKDLFHNKRLD